MKKKLSDQRTEPYSPGWILLVTVLLSTVWFLFQGNVGFSLWDEGFLWHNIQRTFEGDIPIRDFRSYDPGRYYWGAFWFHILGPGIMTQRYAMYILQMVGLFFGILALRRVIASKWLLIPISGLLLLWMYPSYKVVIHSLIMIAVFAAVSLIEKANLRRHFGIGVFIGIVTCIARDFAAYFFLSFLALIGFIEFRERSNDLVRKYAIWAIGILIGYLPIIAMLIFIPGFDSSYIDSVLRIFTPYSPVKPLPIPWPWRTLTADISLSTLLLGVAYIILWAFYLSSAFFISVSKDNSCKRNPLWVACFFIGAPVLFHINGRADFSHFAEGVHPLLIGLIAVAVPAIRKKNRTSLTVTSVALIALLTLVLISSLEVSMALRKVMIIMGGQRQLVATKIGVDTIWVNQEQAKYIEFVREFAADQLKPDENILIAPFNAGFYPILKRHAPIWDAFPIHDAPVKEQEQSIRDLQMHNVRWAIVADYPLDGIEKRRFSKTHPILWNYLVNNFEKIDSSGLPKETYLLHNPSLKNVEQTKNRNGNLR
jgi:hypothetical protein